MSMFVDLTEVVDVTSGEDVIEILQTLPAGPAGARGSVWHEGTGVPSNSLGEVPDFYLNGANGDVYEKTGAATWTLRTNIKGASGSGTVASVTAGDATITIGGTANDPTVKVAAGTFDASGAAAAAQAASQPLDSDLTAIAALTTTSYGRALLALADAAALRTAGGLGTAATVDTGTGAGNAILGNDARLSDTRTPTDNSVTSAKIADGAIVNADINASAAIVLSKLATDPLARANHTGTQTASTVSDFDTQVRTSTLNQMTAPSADLSINSHKLTSLAAPSADSDAARLLDTYAYQSVNTQTADYTLALTDAVAFVQMNKSTAIALHINTDAAVAFPVGTRVDILNIGAGLLTISATTPGTTTLTSKGATSASPTVAQNAGVTAIKAAANTWRIIGDVA